MVYWILVELENDIFLVFGFWLLGFFLLFPNKNYLGFHMRYHLFLQYGWFLQNLGKEAVRTNMHTTVRTSKTAQPNQPIWQNCFALSCSALNKPVWELKILVYFAIQHRTLQL